MRIHALGSNGSGQLGLGHDHDVSEPSLLWLPPGLAQRQQVKQIVAGGNHTLLLTESGHVYVSPASASSASEESSNVFGHIPIKSRSETGEETKISSCLATWDASLFATIDGRVLSVGLGNKGELGLGEGHATASSPSEIPSFPPPGQQVIDLAGCMGHVVAVLSNGDVYGWGAGTNGQLGEPMQNAWSPRRIVVPFPVVRAVCGKDFTCCFSDPAEGRLHFLGHAKRDRFALKTSLPPTLPGWSDIQATWGGLYALVGGRLLGYGRDDRGQLPPSDLPDLKAFAAGSEHVVAVTSSGKVLTWGWGEHGNCGLPVDEQKNVRGRCNELTVDRRAVSVGAGCATSFIVTEGSND